jgi:4-amino-4-deoxy-L-arabinose transferase-like glycosyltransferase
MTAGRYDIFRNELYFIVCGRHPAFGYVDQPPLVPLMAALTQIGGIHVWLLRLPAVIAAVALIPVTVALAQLCGASARGAWLAAVAAASAPLVIAMSATLNTSTFEPLAFTAIAYYVARALARNEPRAFLWAGLIAGLAFEARYGVLIWIAGVVLGLALAGPRSPFRTREAWLGVAVAILVALPNVIWQLVHGLPFLELVRNDSAGNLTGTPAVFTIDQIVSVNVLLAPLWITGIVAPFVSKRLAQYRFLAIAFVVSAALVFVTHGKSYYVAGFYPTAFALGAAACTRLWRSLVVVWAVLAAANGALSLPLVLPVLPPPGLKQMLDHMAFRPRPVEVAMIGAPLFEPFSDEFGWHDLANAVEGVYASLPAAQRARTAIFADNYGEAAAIDVYGKGLPPVISGNNQYYLWGTRGYDGSSVIAVNVDQARWSRLCNAMTVVARFGSSPYVLPYEHDRPIVLCTGMRPPLQQAWPQLKVYGITNLR